MSKVCRTCLEVIENDSRLFSLEINEPTLDIVQIKTKLEACVPEIVLHRVRNSVICSCCLEALNTAYDFKTKCLQSETKIFEYMTHETSDSIDLNHFIKTNTNSNCSTFDQNSDPSILSSPTAETDEMRFGLSDDNDGAYILPDDSVSSISYKCSVCNECFTSSDLLKQHMTYHSDDSLTCSMCEFQTISRVYLEEHLKSHNAVAPIERYCLSMPLVQQSTDITYKCSDCEFSTFYKSLFKEHRAIHTRERLYQCGLCNFRSTHSSSLRRHMKVHTGDRPHRCPECRYGTSDVATLEIHMRIHKGHRPHKCTYCSYSTAKKSNIRTHFLRVHLGNVPNPYEDNQTNPHVNPANVQTETAEQNDEGTFNPRRLDPYQVSIADIHTILQDEEEPSSNTVPNSENITDVNEMELAHSNDLDPFMVTIADIQQILRNKDSDKSKTAGIENGKVVNSNPESELEDSANNAEHCNVQVTQNSNGQNIIFRCPVCNEPFKFKYLLKKHMSVHSFDKPFECSMCSYRTKTKVHMQGHMKTHAGGKIYTCDLCDYTTIYWSNMQKHNRVHTGEKPFKCPLCNYRASQMASVKSHMNIHGSTKPYKCIECAYDTESESDLASHMEVHAVENPLQQEVEPIFVGHAEAT